MTALLSFIILTAYCIYAGTDKSLSATYYKVSKPYLFQVALGLGGFLMMLNLLDMTAGKWYQFLSFFATSALIFVAFHQITGGCLWANHRYCDVPRMENE